MSNYEGFDPQWMDYDDDDYQQNFQQDFIAASVTETTGVTENASFPDHINKKNYQPRTLVDQTLEIIDPTPQINQLFVQFNNKFFNNVLLPVAIRWAPKMTSCAGTCSFHPRNGECIISLSQPLLKLRPRKDLVETLLHEMIHAYLFLTQNNRDRDGHGPEFCKHMNRINREAGTNITIYHTFHAEVALYQQHKWLCNGVCRNRPPFFGKVSRAINRAPGPSDRWYEEHRRTCGGTFIKIAEPENYKKMENKSKDDEKTCAGKKSTKRRSDDNHTLDSWLSPPKDKSNGSPRPGILLGNKRNNINEFVFSSSGTSSATDEKTVGVESSISGLIKLGTSTNNVYGWGTAGPGNFPLQKTLSPNNFNPKFKESGVLGGGGGGGGNFGKSSLLDKFYTSTPINGKINHLSTPSEPIKSRIERVVQPEKVHMEFQECPICHENYPAQTMNEHVDDCLTKHNEDHTPPKSKRARVDGSLVEVNMEFQECPICHENYPAQTMNEHVDDCLTKHQNEEALDSNLNDDQINDKNVDYALKKSQGPRVDDKEKEKIIFKKCPICYERFIAESLDDHVTKCPLASENDDTAMVHCDVCLTWVLIANLEQHVQDCILGQMSEVKTTNATSTLNKKKILERNSNTPLKAPHPERCLICDVLIPPGMTLEQHLEVCNQMEGIYDSTGDDFAVECSICGNSVPLDVINVHQDLCYDKQNK